MAANQFGIDLGQVIGTRNALMNSQQQQQMNALQIQQGQRTQDYQNALSAAPDDPARLGVMQKFDPEKALQYGSQLVGAQRATHDYQVKQTLDALGALTDPKLPDESLPEAVNAVKANLSSQGVPTASLDQALQQSGGDPAKLRTALSFALSQGMDYQSRLNEQDKAATRAQSKDTLTETTRHNTAAETEASRHNAAVEGKPIAVPYGSTLVTPGGKTVASPGLGDTGGTSQDPVVASHVQNILNGNESMANVPAPLKNKVSVAMASTPKDAYSPLAGSRFTMEANRIVGNFVKLPQYQLTANGLPYLQRIDAAMKTPGSVSDQDLLDSLTKLNTAGNAITDAQVKLITDGKSYADWVGTIGNKFKNGGVLSNNQRQQIQEIAKNIYANYKKGYQPVYDQATKQLKDSGVPESFWTIPDLNKLGIAGQSTGEGSPHPQDGATATGPNGQKLILKGGQWTPQ